MTHEAPETRPRAAEHAPATLDCHLGHGVRLRVTTHSDGSVHLSLLRRDGRPAPLLLQADGLELVARGAARLSGAAVEITAHEHCDVRAGGQLRLWADDGVGEVAP